MSDTVLYFEGGGKREGRAQLRRALERFLNAGGDEPAGRAKPTRPLRVVACGSRGEALKRFRRAVERHGNTASLLLIDSEGPMDWTRETPTAFLARQDGAVVESIRRYHQVLLGLSGRRGLRNDLTRYESLAVALVRTEAPAIRTDWPGADSPLRFDAFFDRLFREYDQRYVFAAPRLSAATGRVVWSADSPAFSEPMARDYTLRCDG